MPLITPIQNRLLEAATDTLSGPSDRPSFVHAILCQCGLPRSRVQGEIFERTSGNASLRLRSGALWDGSKGMWVQQALPYGTRARLALLHVSSEAVRTRSPIVEIGTSTREFLVRLGLDDSGREYRTLTTQMRALAAAEMRLGIGFQTLIVQPIEEFEAWLHPTGNQKTLWPGTIRLSPKFFESLQESAVPLDPRAIGGLSHSSLALDAYAWLAHRLHRVRAPGERVSWKNLKDQFGQEYSEERDFRREMKKALVSVTAVYPDAKLEDVRGGIVLKPSPPPIPKLILPGSSL